jgi:DNA-3-methyladenine glycosylase II
MSAATTRPSKDSARSTRARRVSLATATAELAARDPALAALIEATGPCTLRAERGGNRFAALASAIVFQQLAGKAATAIWQRVETTVGPPLTPERVLATPVDALRAAGLSAAKATSIRDLAAKVADGTVPLDNLHRLRDDDVVARLVTVRGIGRWTAEMFLIFSLRRLDVWPVDDYGVRKGYARLYGLAELPSPRALAAEGERFRPYRTIAAWYCWRVVDDLVLPT